MRPKNLLLLLLAALPIGACSTEPGIVERTLAPGLARGIDLAIDGRDVALELKDSHPDFVARYYRDPASRWPALSAAEAQTLSAAGMRLVAVWEWHSQRPDYFSYDSGFADAQSAYRQAKAIGQPPGSAIYFAVDYNAPEIDIHGVIDRYFRGIYAGLYAAGGGVESYRIGVYGSGAVCDYLKRMRLAEYAWLSNSTAWNGYASFTEWNIKQEKASSTLSFGHDWNNAREDFGGFQVPSQYTSL